MTTSFMASLYAGKISIRMKFVPYCCLFSSISKSLNPPGFSWNFEQVIPTSKILRNSSLKF